TIDWKPALAPAEALTIGAAYTGSAAGDRIWKGPALEIVPCAPPQYEIGGAFVGPIGRGYDHRLVWVYGLSREGSAGRWEVMVDAGTGELLAFEDTAAYLTTSITGGVYPLSNTGICPS